ncbi:MAG: Ig-like domain-containing protein [Rikenellaceae bacterium]|nr:Ig-like domain-containing protein [Rikenellaceae bacterium]
MKRFHFIYTIAASALLFGCSDSKDEPVPVDGNGVEAVQLNVSGVISLGAAGDTRSVSATFSPADADDIDYYWAAYRSSDSKVFTVDAGGVLTAVGRGTAYLTVYAPYNTEVSADYEVTVEGAPVTSVTFNTAGFSQNITSSSDSHYSTDLARYVTVAPESADYRSLLWTSSDESIVDVNRRGYITAVGGGYATIRAEAADGSGVYDEVTLHSTYSDWVAIPMDNWTVTSSPSGTDYGGAGAESIKTGDAVNLIKPGQTGGPAAGEDMYILIDMGQPSPVNYFTISHTWIGEVSNNNNTRVQGASFYGSNDGNNFTAMQENITISRSVYDIRQELNNTYTYRYIKVVFDYPTATTGGAHCVVFTNFRLGEKTIYD